MALILFSYRFAAILLLQQVTNCIARASTWSYDNIHLYNSHRSSTGSPGIQSILNLRKAQQKQKQKQQERNDGREKRQPQQQQQQREKATRHRLWKSSFISTDGSLRGGGLNELMKDYTTAFVTGALKSSAADYIAQKAENSVTDPSINNKKGIDWKRNLSFLLYGGTALGIFYEFVYNDLFQKWFGSNMDIRTALNKTLYEVLIVAPFGSIPVSYIITAAINGTSQKEAFKKYWNDVTRQHLVTTYILVFGPFQVLLFTFVPPHLRMTIASIVTFLWLMLLSKVSSS